MTGPLRVDNRDVGKAGDNSLFRIKVLTCGHIDHDTVPTNIWPHDREGLGSLRLKTVYKTIR